MSESVHLLIHVVGGPRERLWGNTIAPGILDLNNFPVSDVDYSNDYLVMGCR
jgi:hypothetical protein